MNQYVNSAVLWLLHGISEQIKLFGHTRQLFNYFELRTKMIGAWKTQQNELLNTCCTIEWSKQYSIKFLFSLYNLQCVKWYQRSHHVEHGNIRKLRAIQYTKWYTRTEFGVQTLDFPFQLPIEFIIYTTRHPKLDLIE